MHYRRILKTGDPGPAEAKRSALGSTCRVGDCDQKPVAEELCRKHYRSSWHKRNSSRIAEYNAAYYASNREKYARWNRDWAANNPDQKRVTDSRVASVRRSRMKVPAAAVFTAEQWIQKVSMYGGKCWICRTAPYEHMDHVKPLCAGGLHVLANIRPACQRCNYRKNRAWPFDAAAFRLKLGAA